MPVFAAWASRQIVGVPVVAYGRDLADSYEKGQPLTLEPPYSLATAHTLFVAMTKRGVPNLNDSQRAAAEADLLSAQGLSYYHFMIGHNWWSRKAKIEALAGDASLLSAYYSSAGDAEAATEAATPESSGVNVGGNVRTGGGVHIGSASSAKGAVHNPAKHD